MRPIDMPYCPLVRDAFLDRQDTKNSSYYECTCDAWTDRDNGYVEPWQFNYRIPWRAPSAFLGTDARVTGLRAEESSKRKRRKDAFGEESPNSLAPLIGWKGWMVFAYLAKYHLPIHPVYAMSFAGSLDRTRLRVGVLGSNFASGAGQNEHEGQYWRCQLLTLWSTNESDLAPMSDGDRWRKIR